MNYPKQVAKGLLIVFLCHVPALVALTFQQKKNRHIKQEKFLNDVPFDRVILYALIAIERNYKFRERLIPKVHVDDYYTLIPQTPRNA